MNLLLTREKKSKKSMSFCVIVETRTSLNRRISGQQYHSTPGTPPPYILLIQGPLQGRKGRNRDYLNNAVTCVHGPAEGIKLEPVLGREASHLCSKRGFRAHWVGFSGCNERQRSACCPTYRSAGYQKQNSRGAEAKGGFSQLLPLGIGKVLQQEVPVRNQRPLPPFLP